MYEVKYEIIGGTIMTVLVGENDPNLCVKLARESDPNWLAPIKVRSALGEVWFIRSEVPK